MSYTRTAADVYERIAKVDVLVLEHSNLLSDTHFYKSFVTLQSR